jgi:hypothetical protein
MKLASRFTPGRAAFASLAAVALIASAAIVPSLATGETVPTGVTDTVYMQQGGKHGLRFVAPPTVHVGDTLTVINQTNPHKVGPHTFALVTQQSIPKTKRAQKSCFKKGHLCKAIEGWFGGPKLLENPTLAGLPGWDTPGNKRVKGDAWFTGETPGTSISQTVTSAPTQLFFFCAIHPFMKGSVQVLP